MIYLRGQVADNKIDSVHENLTDINCTHKDIIKQTVEFCSQFSDVGPTCMHTILNTVARTFEEYTLPSASVNIISYSISGIST